MTITLSPGFYSWVIPSGEIRIFHVAVEQQIILSFDAGYGTYQLISPEGTSSYVHSEEENPVQPIVPTVSPTILGPGDLVLMEHFPSGGIVSFWGNLAIVPDTGEIRCIAPQSPGTYPISLNGNVVSSITVVQAIKHNAKVDCSSIAEPATYTVDIYPVQIPYNGTAIATICMRNPNNVTADVDVPKIKLPEGLTASPPIEVASFTLAPLAQACRSFIITANNKTVTSFNFDLTVGGVSSVLTTGGMPELSKVTLEYMRSSNIKARVGASYYVEALVKNKTKSDVLVTLAQLNSTLVRIEGERTGSYEIPALGHRTFRWYCIAESAGAATISIPVGALTATLSGTTVVVSGTKSVNVTQIP